MPKANEETPMVAEPMAVQPMPQTYTPPPRRTIERQGGPTVPYTHRYPEVRGGVCEWCGVIDRTKPSNVQYLLCPHFSQIGELRCSYCDASKDPNDVIYRSTLNVHDHPTDATKIVVVCDSYECSNMHLKRFQVNRV